jgi:hypothetical protein
MALARGPARERARYPRFPSQHEGLDYAPEGVGREFRVRDDERVWRVAVHFDPKVNRGAHILPARKPVDCRPEFLEAAT